MRREPLVVAPEPGEVLQDVDPGVGQRLRQAVGHARRQREVADVDGPAEEPALPRGELVSGRVLYDGRAHPSTSSTMTRPHML